MAYVVARSGGRWEIRESRATKAGPRSRTLATFKVLTDEILEKAGARSSGSFDRDKLRATARRVGAQVELPQVEQAARDLLSELATGERPTSVLRDLIVDALADGHHEVSDSARAAAQWTGIGPNQRAKALRDLLLLGDALPRRNIEGPTFPRFESQSA